MQVVIIGNSGSGKTTLATALAAARAMPHLDLDAIAWEPTRAATPRDEALVREEVRTFCRESDAWVVEGCYTTLVGVALERSPWLLFLNPGLDACLAGCRARPWEPHKYASKADQDANLPQLLDWVAEYYRRPGPLSLAAHRECFDAYAGPKRELRAPPALPELLRELALDRSR